VIDPKTILSFPPMHTLIRSVRRPRRVALWLFAFTASLSAVAQTTLTVRAERESALYKVGEPVTFRVKAGLSDANGGHALPTKARWKLTSDGAAVVDSGTLELVDGAGVVSGSLGEPGFLRLAVEVDAPGLTKNGKPVPQLAAVGVEPERIQASRTAPADFDEFWAEQKRALAAIPVNLKLTPVKSPAEGILVFDFKADCVDGVPVTGYFAWPENAKPGELPAIMMYQGAGVRDASITSVVTRAKRGLLAGTIGAHGLPNAMGAEFYEEKAKTALLNYWHAGRESREQSYFRGMFLRVLRSIDAMAELPVWDNKTLIAHGSSQGSAQSIVAAALDKRVTLVVGGVTAMCEHGGLQGGRVVGWPKWVKRDANGKPDPATLEASAYYDMVHFAERATCEARFTVGFIDVGCPPSAFYAMANRWGGKREIFNDVTCGHRNSPEALAWMSEQGYAHAEARKVAKAAK
jgi:Acetyl esterase (deacetylase)